VNALRGTGVGTVAVVPLEPDPPPPPLAFEEPGEEREVPLTAVVALEETLPLVPAVASTVVEPEVAAEESAEVE